MQQDTGCEAEKLRRLLRKLRRERGVTQTELARKIGLPQPRIAEYESGRREVRAVELFAVLSALGLSMQTFWRRWHTASLDDCE